MSKWVRRLVAVALFAVATVLFVMGQATGAVVLVGIALVIDFVAPKWLEGRSDRDA